MREYIIKGRKGKKTWGKLYYSDKTGKFRVVFREDIDIAKENPPALVRCYIEAGYWELKNDFAMMWVTDRIIPKDRQNIDSILRENGLTFYREIDMLELCSGRCTHDDMYLERIT